MSKETSELFAKKVTKVEQKVNKIIRDNTSFSTNYEIGNIIPERHNHNNVLGDIGKQIDALLNKENK